MPSTLIFVGALWSRSFSSRRVYFAMGLSGSKKPEPTEDPAVPAVHAVTGDGERPLAQGLARVVERGQVDVVDGAAPLAARAHAAGDAEAAALLDRLPRALHRDRAGPADRRHVERVRLRRADVRRRETAEQDPQHRVGVGGRPDGGPGIATEPLLVDDDRGRQPVEDVHLGARQRRHEPLHERAVGLVDHPLRLRGDRAEHQRALARPGDAGEDGQPALGQLDADVLEVVHPRPLDADELVTCRRRAAPRPGSAAVPGSGSCCRPGRGRRSRGRRRAGRSAPGRSRRRRPGAVRRWRPDRRWPAAGSRRCPWPSSRRWCGARRR